MCRVYVGRRGSCIWGDGERDGQNGEYSILSLVARIPEQVPLFGPVPDSTFLQTINRECHGA